jgi:hypothetical protein
VLAPPAVAGIRCPLHEPLSLCPVDQFDDTVVTPLELVGQLPHGRPLPAGKPLKRQQRLVLLRGQVLPTRCFVDEAQITVDPERNGIEQRLQILFRAGS